MMSMSFTENAIPQLATQAVYIPEGNDNNIQQLIEQDIIIYVLAIADLENQESVSKFIQTSDDIGEDNQVSQDTQQTIANFTLFTNSPADSEVINHPLNLDFNQFINNDDLLETIQFSHQQVDIEGNNNSVDLFAEQIIYDLSWYDEYGLNADYVFDENITFDDFLENLTVDYLLDSVQTGVQDVVLYGGGNKIIQQLDQTLATFIFLDEDFAEELEEQSSNSLLAQFAFQESLLDTNNNTIEQIVTQNIKLDFSFSNEPNSELGELTGEQLSDPQFDINGFISPILDNVIADSPLFENHEVLANQDILQTVKTVGNDNIENQDTSQIIVFSEGDSREVVLGSRNDDTFVVGLTENFDGLEDLVLTGRGDDRVNLSNAFVELNITPFLIPTNTIVRAGKGKDQVIAYRGDEIFGNRGNDLLQTAEGGSENIFYGGRGNDTIIAGKNDTLFGNKGADLLNGGDDDDMLYGGRNDDTVNGNSGNDQLWGNRGADLLNGGDDDDMLYGGRNDDTLNGDAGDDKLWGNWGDDLLRGGEGRDTFVLDKSRKNSGIDTIEDFQTGVDLIGLSGGLTFDDLSFSQSNILHKNQILAILSGLDATSLTEADFIVVGEN